MTTKIRHIGGSRDHMLMTDSIIWSLGVVIMTMMLNMKILTDYKMTVLRRPVMTDFTGKSL